MFITSGVPQGFNLGLLFLKISMNDLPQSTQYLLSILLAVSWEVKIDKLIKMFKQKLYDYKKHVNIKCS